MNDSSVEVVARLAPCKIRGRRLLAFWKPDNHHVLLRCRFYHATSKAFHRVGPYAQATLLFCSAVAKDDTAEPILPDLTSASRMTRVAFGGSPAKASIS